MGPAIVDTDFGVDIATVFGGKGRVRQFRPNSRRYFVLRVPVLADVRSVALEIVDLLPSSSFGFPVDAFRMSVTLPWVNDMLSKRTSTPHASNEDSCQGPSRVDGTDSNNNSDDCEDHREKLESEFDNVHISRFVQSCVPSSRSVVGIL